MDKRLLLPGDPEFDATLGLNLPPNWRQFAQSNHGDFGFVARAGSGILEPVTFDGLIDYVEGGEYDERLDELDDDEFLDEFEDGWL